MAKSYGATREWSTVNAPHLFSGICENYTYADVNEETQVEGETDIEAIVMDRRKGEISFEATITSDTTDFLDITGGCKLAVDGIETGVVLVTEVVETWGLRTAKRGSVRANHYPHMVDTEGALAAVNVNAMTPSLQSGINIRPGGKVIWSTAGLTHTAGTVAELTLTQRVRLEEDDDEVGRWVAAYVSNYTRAIELTLTSTGAPPEPDTVLTITGAPANAGGYIISRVEDVYSKGAKRVYRLQATWSPVLAPPSDPPEEV